MAIALLVGPNAWDDGAITLAYSKTFGESGKIALTHASEVVEGFSSYGCFLINAALALARPTFEGAILGSQVMAGIFLGVTLAFVWLLCNRLAFRCSTTFAILTTLAAFGPSVSEIANGMEVTLLSAAGVGLFYGLYFRRSIPLILVCSVVFLAARFEAMVYFAAIASPLLLQERYRDFIKMALIGLAVVALLAVARYLSFADWLPNTIYAKSQAPYHLSGGAALRSRAKATLEAFIVVAPILALVVSFQ